MLIVDIFLSDFRLASSASEESSIVVDVSGALESLRNTQNSAAAAVSGAFSMTSSTPKRRRTAKANPPSAKKGVHMADNPKHHLKDLAEVGKPDDSKLRFKLKMVRGGYTKAFRFEGRKNPDWNNKEWVDGLKKWRIKTLKRYYTIEDAAPKVRKTGPRVRWSYAELEYLRMQIRKRVRSTGTALSGKDWKKLTEQHNERFQGKLVRIGEKLASGKIAVSEQVIERRSQPAITALYGKYDDLRRIVEKEIKAYGTEGSDDTDSSSDTDTFDESDESDEEESGAMDYNLEDRSDDEDEGRRPAAQHVGGVLVNATS